MTKMLELLGWPRRVPVAALLLGIMLALTACKESVEQLVADAASLRESGNFPAAEVKLKAALQQDPKNLRARLLAAQIYIDLGQGDAALGLLLRAQRDGASAVEIAEPRAEAELVAHRYQDVVRDTASPPEGLSNAARASLLAFRGAALAALGHAGDAGSAFQAGLALDPHSVAVRIAETRLAIDRGDLDAARRELADARRDAPDDPRLRQLDGDIAYTARDYPAADGIYQKILGAEPWNDLARGELAAVQVAEGKLSEAIASLDKVLKDPNLANVPKLPLLNYIRAVAAFQLKDYAAAQTNAAVVISAAPAFNPAWLIAGASSYALRDDEEAYYYLSPYVSQNPGSVQARKLLAETQLRLGRPRDADKMLMPLRGGVTDDPQLLTLIGIAAGRSGDAAVADRYLKLALDQQPDNRQLRTELGLADIAIGDPKAAIANLQQVLKSQADATEPQVPLFVAFMQAKEYDKGLAIAEQLIKGEPKSPTGQLLAAAAYLAQRNIAAGRAALLKAREIDPGNVNANVNLAKLALAAGKVEEARGYYQDLLAASPQNVTAYGALAAIDARTGQLQQAEAVLLKGVLANPTDPAIRVALLRLQLGRGEAQQALDGGREALKKFPRNPALLDIVGHAELALGQRDAALSTFHALVDITPEAAIAHADLAEAFLAEFTPNSPQWPAINEATEAVKLDPKDTTAKLVLARALVMHGRFDEAAKVVDQLKAGAPQAIDVIELEGLVARGQGKLAEAAAAFGSALALKDNGPDRRRLAAVEVALNRPQDAAKTLMAWLDGRPDDSEAREMLAGIFMKAGQFAEASAQYTELARRQPKDPLIQNNLAWLLSRLEQPEEALVHARMAVALAPASGDFRDTLGGILLRSGNSAEALDALEQAWRLSADRPDIGLHLSQALAAAGRTGEALALLRQLLAGQNTFAGRAQAQDLLHQLGG